MTDVKNYICQCITPKISASDIAKVKVPVGGLHAGQIVLLDELDSTISGNIEVFSATKPLTANLGHKRMALVINDGFETMVDGRRPNGQPNYYNYEFKEGDIAPVVFLHEGLMFNIGTDSITSGSAVTKGQFLYPVDNSNDLTGGESIPEGTAKGLKVLAKYNTALGGLFGAQFATSLICIVE